MQLTDKYPSHRRTGYRQRGLRKRPLFTKIIRSYRLNLLRQSIPAHVQIVVITNRMLHAPVAHFTHQRRFVASIDLFQIHCNVLQIGGRFTRLHQVFVAVGQTGTDRIEFVQLFDVVDDQRIQALQISGRIECRGQFDLER